MIPRAARSSLALFIMLAAATVPWRAPAVASTTGKVTGLATYRERVALTPRAVFEATLLDVSRSDAPAEVISSMRKPNPGQIPITFEIAYDPRRINTARTYVVRATISEEGRLRFTTDHAVPVLTHDHGNKVKIVMRGAGGGSMDRVPRWERGEPPSLGTIPATFSGLLPCPDCTGIRYQINLLPGGAYMQRRTYLRGRHESSLYDLGAWSLSSDRRTMTLEGDREGDEYWRVTDSRTLQKLTREGNPVDSKRSYELTRSPSVLPMEPRLKMKGMFRAVSDAPRFRECRSGLQWPVGRSGDYRALERAYIARRAAPGAELMVSIDGRIEQRPRMEGRFNQPTLVVMKFMRAMPGEKCEDRNAQAGLANNRWLPIRIGDQAVVVSRGEREPWIELDSRSKRVTGSGGCNRISGPYQAGDGTLRFGPLITTKTACRSMDTETRFLRALNDTRRYRILGRLMVLLDDRGRLLARLEERNLR
jgi:copper homeostasis protein (lipoprotein)